MRVLVAVLGSLLLAAPASAQTLGPEISLLLDEVRGGPMLDLTANTTFEIDYRWECPAIASVPARGPQYVALSAVADHPGIIVTMPEGFLVPQEACFTEKTGEGTFKAQVWPDVYAPGERMVKVAVKADPSGDAQMTESTVMFPVVVPYRGALEVTAGDIPAFVGGTVKVPFTVTNVGNSRSAVAFEASVNDARVTIEAPDELVLGSVNQGSEDSSQVVEVVLRRDTFDAVDGLEVTLTATPISTKDVDLVGEPAASSTDVVDGGGNYAVPAPGILYVAPLVAGALLRRR